MRNALDIYNETCKECLDDNCQSTHSMAIISIEKAQREMFEYLLNLAIDSKDENLISFFDELDGKLMFKN